MALPTLEKMTSPEIANPVRNAIQRKIENKSFNNHVVLSEALMRPIDDIDEEHILAAESNWF